MINHAFKMLNEEDRKDALRRKTVKKKSTDSVPLVTTYSIHLPNIHNIVKSLQIRQDEEGIPEATAGRLPQRTESGGCIDPWKVEQDAKQGRKRQYFALS